MTDIDNVEILLSKIFGYCKRFAHSDNASIINCVIGKLQELPEGKASPSSNIEKSEKEKAIQDYAKELYRTSNISKEDAENTARWFYSTKVW